jgi:hypothetical protein
MNYKEAQAKAKAALRTSRVRWDGATLNLGIRRFKRDHPHLKGRKVAQFKTNRWATADKWQEGRA